MNNERVKEEKYEKHYTIEDNIANKVDLFIQLFVLIFGAGIFVADKVFGATAQNIPDMFYGAMLGVAVVGKKISVFITKFTK